MVKASNKRRLTQITPEVLQSLAKKNKKNNEFLSKKVQNMALLSYNAYADRQREKEENVSKYWLHEDPNEKEDLEYNKELSNKYLNVYLDHDNKRLYGAVRGTKEVNDFFTDALLVLGLDKHASRYKNMRKQVLSAIESFEDYDVVLTGHSLGGHDAQELAKDPQLKEFIDEVHSFNPGSSSVGLSSDIHLLIPPSKPQADINVYHVSGDVISTLARLDKHKVYSMNQTAANAHTIHNFLNPEVAADRALLDMSSQDLPNEDGVTQ